MEMKMNRKKWMGIAGAGVLVLIIIIAVICGIRQRTHSGSMKQDQMYQQLWELGKEMEQELNGSTIYPGVKVMGIDLSGMTQQEAEEAIEGALDGQLGKNKVVLQYGDKKWTYTFEELGAIADAKTMAEQAFAIGRKGDLRQRRQIIEKLKKQTEDMPLSVMLDETKLTTVLDTVAKELEVQPVDAVIQANGSEFSVTAEKKGLILNREKTIEEIQKALLHGEDNKTVTPVMDEVLPEKTSEKLSSIHDRIGTYSTYYSTSNYGREQNLITGASKVNGIILMPDEILSFNNTVAPITVENGYHEASVIVGDEYVPGLGGGLCQVSTTLYNAVIRAELEIVERDCHSFPSDYVPMGLDATVAQGYIDFQFKNTSGHPIYIAMWCGGGEIGASIYGTEIHDPSRSVSFDYVVTRVIDKPQEEVKEDATLAPGQRVVYVTGHTGYEVDVYKTVTEKGSTTTEWFNSSSYMATPDKVKVGPAKPVTPSNPTTPTNPTTPVKPPEESSTPAESQPPQESQVPPEESQAPEESSAASETDQE